MLVAVSAPVETLVPVTVVVPLTDDAVNDGAVMAGDCVPAFPLTGGSARSPFTNISIRMTPARIFSVDFIGFIIDKRFSFVRQSKFTGLAGMGSKAAPQWWRRRLGCCLRNRGIHNIYTGPELG